MGTTEILFALIKIFIMLIPGFILKKKNILTVQHSEGLSSIITYVTSPCMVITAMQMEYSAKILNDSKYMVLTFLGIFITALLVSRLVTKLVKLPKWQGSLLAFMLLFGNTGFIGLPVLNGLFGHKAVFYGALFDASCDVFMFTLGMALLRYAANDKASQKSSFKSTLKNILSPCVFGVILGLTLYCLNITLPEFLWESISAVGATTTPLAMFIIGIQLADIRFKALLSDKYN
ncbi:MAG: AEC family transporter [Anaerovoracaceae bacterium]